MCEREGGDGMSVGDLNRKMNLNNYGIAGKF